MAGNKKLRIDFDNINDDEAADLTAAAMKAKAKYAPEARATALKMTRKGIGWFKRKELGSGDE